MAIREFIEKWGEMATLGYVAVCALVMNHIPVGDSDEHLWVKLIIRMFFLTLVPPVTRVWIRYTTRSNMDGELRNSLEYLYHCMTSAAAMCCPLLEELIHTHRYFLPFRCFSGLVNMLFASPREVPWSSVSLSMPDCSYRP
ncbi:hypothetical protein DM860_008752 [Cuscuta australis]|uniref:Uncharacterized protein n=1 Tax=Cuscuta australis TaxID=267555 RepID=A0A328D6J9_9ASTE|nr:hypothetical protein DM860_008752 [Cuscuta australis]